MKCQLFGKSQQLLFVSDATMDRDSKRNTEITVRMFSKDTSELPPLKGVGDFVYLKDVAIEEWKGNWRISVLYWSCA